MPAVTADTLTLKRIPAPKADAVERPVNRLTTAPSGYEGEGFPVRRALAGVPKNELDPFVMMDQMGEVEYAAGEPRGTSWHPHRGFETVTYLLDGTFLHQDSHGGGGVIRDGATQWMTAGAGILHIETPPAELVESGGLFHGFQLWVNLPAKDKFAPPRYQNLEANQVVLLASDDAGSLIRLIAGDLGGHKGPGSTYTPIIVAHATVFPGERLRLDWPREFNALAYVLAGSGTVGAELRPITMGQLAVFGPGDQLTIAAEPKTKEPLEVILLGGQPIGEPVEQYGPFVMNTRAELAEAVADYQAGKLGVIPPGALMPHVYSGA